MTSKSLSIGLFISLIIHLGLFTTFLSPKLEVDTKFSTSSLVVTVTSLEPITKKSAKHSNRTKQQASGDMGVAEKKKVELIGSLAPEYPWRSRMNNEEGAVEMVFIVYSFGQATNIRIAKSSGFESLDAAAIAAIKKARFTVGGDDAQEMSISLNFKLKEQNDI